MLRNYNNAVDFDFYEYTQYYDFLCLTLPSGNPLETAVDNYFSEDDGYLTDQIAVYPQYKASDLLGLPKGCTTKMPISEYSDLERELLERINALGIGPQGFGGRTTALAVHIKTLPTHIAGLPCAVNINCHVSRHVTEVL